MMVDYPRPIRGGADDGPRERIRARLRDGTLPLVDGRAWAGQGRGVDRCACCDEVIRRTDHQYEPQDHVGRLHAHAPCFTIWLAESVAQRRLDGGPAS